MATDGEPAETALTTRRKPIARPVWKTVTGGALVPLFAAERARPAG